MSTTLKLTPREYDTMIANGAFVGIDRKIELIHGELREMSPAGPSHFDYINFLTRWSTQVMTDRECVIQVQGCINLQDSRPEPDLAWLKPGRYPHHHPGPDDVLLLIEVADSTLEFDRGEKLELYAIWNIAEYWVVDIQGKCVHQYRDSDGNTYQTYQCFAADETLSPLCKPECSLVLSELFVD